MPTIPLPALPVNVSDVVNTTGNITSTGLEIARGVAHTITGFIPLGGGFAFGLQHIIELVIVHMIVLFVFHRVAGLLKSVVIAGVASALLPVVLSKVFGFAIPLTLQTLVTFAVFGVGIYIVLAIFWKIAIGKAVKAA
jgi:hypothetical protein